MSLRILGPPPRKVPFFDDGDLPLSARVLDEDYAFVQVANQSRLYLQPFFDEYVLPLSAVRLDEELDRGSLVGPLRASFAVQPLADDEILIGAAPALAGDEDSPTLTWLSVKSYPQPQTDDEALIGAPPVPLEDDVHALSLQTVLKAIAYGQPVADDETIPLSGSMIEEDWQAAPARALGLIVAQPIGLEEDYPSAAPVPDVTPPAEGHPGRRRTARELETALTRSTEEFANPVFRGAQIAPSVETPLEVIPAFGLSAKQMPSSVPAIKRYDVEIATVLWMLL